MLKDVKELKELLKWAKAEGIKNLQVGDIKAEFSDLALTLKLLPESLTETGDPKPSKEEKSTSTKTLTDTENMTPEDEEELLFHSARP